MKSKDTYQLSEEILIDLNALLCVKISNFGLTSLYDSTEKIKNFILKEIDCAIRTYSYSIQPISYSGSIISKNVVSDKNTEDVNVK